MSDRKDGGAAFPLGMGLGGANEGMSLRDWFAAAALQATLRANGNWLDADGNIDCAAAAKDAYQYADAMLAQREKP